MYKVEVTLSTYNLYKMFPEMFIVQQMPQTQV